MIRQTDRDELVSFVKGGGTRLIIALGELKVKDLSLRSAWQYVIISKGGGEGGKRKKGKKEASKKKTLYVPGHQQSQQSSDIRARWEGRAEQRIHAETEGCNQETRAQRQSLPEFKGEGKLMSGVQVLTNSVFYGWAVPRETSDPEQRLMGIGTRLYLGKPPPLLLAAIKERGGKITSCVPCTLA